MLYGKRLTGEELVIFTHIPKTAGSSLFEGIADLMGREASKDFRWPGKRPAEMTTDEKAPLRFVSGHFPYGVHVHFTRTPLYLAVVRDPVERFYSVYHFIRRNPDHPNFRFFDGLSAENALRVLLDNPAAGSNVVGNPQCRYLSGRPAFEAARSAVDERYFLVGAMPQVNDLFALLARALGKAAPPLAEHNVGQRRYQASREIERMIGESCADDFRLCDYVASAFHSTLAPQAKSRLEAPGSAETLTRNVVAPMLLSHTRP